MTMRGIAVSAGIAFGQAKVLRTYESKLDYHLLPPSQLAREQQRLNRALKTLIKQSQACAAKLDPESDNYQLIEADLLLLEDEELLAELSDTIGKRQFSAALAVEHSFAKQAQAMQEADSPYLARRAEDVLSLGQRLIRTLLTGHCDNLSRLPENAIVLAKDITPAEFATLPLERVSALVLQTGGVTSHTAILARSAGIPTLMSCPWQTLEVTDGMVLAVDAINGELYLEPDETQIDDLNAQKQQADERKSALLALKGTVTQTKDGRSIPLLANVGCISEINHLADVGAEGVGLFRTEFLFMNNHELPDENRQYQLYCDALQLLDGKPLTIRSMDLGADKEVPTLAMDSEENPALGLRGVRYTLAHPKLFSAQLKAILRAANHGPIRLMFPMVNQVEELEAVLALLELCKQELVEAEKGFGELELGIVVETPAAVFNLASMLPLLDFVSIGTNDLTQYTMAADRANPLLIDQYPVLSPVIIRLIAQIIEQAKAAKVRVSMCGELASNPSATALLIGLGLEEFSVNLASLLEVKQALSRWSYPDCVELAHKALQISRIDALNQLLTHCHS
ncbi:phosphoenolpyruvate--protein phosphotransferase [Shewanella loihica]|uniref:Phosphoenolpyruvate-protein phosphotransferase n=1 Tax=Shewanella loihica (strain ATCC BAA-1088 / PV-4) TaxID=323850 RepID=A3QE33_SHELP|nr:phosphoenolpyruvate--protein phosphotransferase [Shewanella loihica]ABO23731.1 phosphoenolpyruvate--protein phosphotransferase [Shewanella loihica PV-4]